MLSVDKRDCVPCPPYTRPQANGQCEADDCIFSNFIVNEEGKCKACPEGTIGDATKRFCEKKEV